MTPEVVVAQQDKLGAHLVGAPLERTGADGVLPELVSQLVVQALGEDRCREEGHVGEERRVRGVEVRAHGAIIHYLQALQGAKQEIPLRVLGKSRLLDRK